MRNVLFVALGGAAGALARYLVGIALAGPSLQFPWSTLTVNVVGAFALGVLVGATPPTAVSRLALGVGACGGFTTFSTYALEAVTLAQRGLPGRAGAYVVGSVVAGVLAAVAGLAVGRLLGSAR
ncbi:MAG TPA: fluoride efflux transporter CrcB [Gemmatirosa sp.]|nr:fluoride efflux transporter CrcB [Gemmatirosa sp.]